MTGEFGYDVLGHDVLRGLPELVTFTPEALADYVAERCTPLVAFVEWCAEDETGHIGVLARGALRAFRGEEKDGE